MRQVGELTPAPSVGLHEVPRETVYQHLGFGKDEEEGRDPLDASVARESWGSVTTHIDIIHRSEHARFVYNLQEAENHSDDSDDPDVYRWDSDDSVASSSRRRRLAPRASKKRMSILTNQYYDIPSYENGFEYAVPGKPETRRRFFQSLARWDAGRHQVVIPGRQAIEPPPLHDQIYNQEHLSAATLRRPNRRVRYFQRVEEDGSTEGDDETSGVLESDSVDEDISVMEE